jgi:hypothetical protein
MNTELEETPFALPDFDEEDLWVRGRVYACYKHLLNETEEHICELEHHVARARYEHEITQRIGNKLADPQERQDWEINETVAHDCMAMAEQELAEATDNAAYYRAMVAEIESDLGEKAQEYLLILATLDWEDEWWDEEDLDEFDEYDEFEDEFGELDDEGFDPSAPIPF